MSCPVVHCEIGVKDTEKAKRFYGTLFDWKFESYGPAQMFNPGQKEGAIGGHINALGHEPHNYVTVYVQVSDLAKYAKRAEELGGKTLIPPQEVPGMGHFAWIRDPEGNCIGLWKPL